MQKMLLQTLGYISTQTNNVTSVKKETYNLRFYDNYTFLKKKRLQKNLSNLALILRIT